MENVCFLVKVTSYKSNLRALEKGAIREFAALVQL